ncbi:MAG: homocysteine S-methyltransferase family protein [Myxococcota bacterium]|nr:homocysteine S-methyltransferase family protein [Myxococcota bacterium]
MDARVYPRSGGREIARQPARLSERLRQRAPLVADGATGTELERRGAHTGLPLWSTHALLDAPELVEAIHRDYVLAGAELLTANTFRTQTRTLARGGAGDRAAELTALAVELARRAAAAGPGPIWIAGSMPTLEDCYRPDLVPPDDALAREHAEHAGNLAAAGCDLVLVETMNSVREARAATRAARDTDLPVWVSFVTDAGARLLSGEPLREALDAITPLEPLAVGVNCLPPRCVAPALPLLAATGLPVGVYANLGAPNDETGFTRSDDCSPAELAEAARRWLAAGVRLIGGCCGTTPEHVRALAQLRVG